MDPNHLVIPENLIMKLIAGNENLNSSRRLFYCAFLWLWLAYPAKLLQESNLVLQIKINTIRHMNYYISQTKLSLKCKNGNQQIDLVIYRISSNSTKSFWSNRPFFTLKEHKAKHSIFIVLLYVILRL